MSESYWQEALEIALDEVGAFHLLTKEQIESVAESIATSAENRGTACGYDAIPNPMEAEMSSANQHHKRELAEMQNRLDCMRKNIAQRIGVDPHRVGVHNGRVEVSPN